MNKELSFNQRETVIAKYPLFYLLNHKDIHELAKTSKEINIDEGATITKEGDIVDSVYLILSGEAKVTRIISSDENKKAVELATLTNGDAIGLANTGFFSPIGVRTATVSAMTPMVLLAFDLEGFQKFLQRPGVTYPALKNTGDKMLLMNFIQQSHLFQHFSIPKIQWLAKRVKKVLKREGTILYKKGDVADEFYFIVYGSVSLTADYAKGKSTTLYESYSIFGEKEFTDNTLRTNTARVEKDCELFMLERNLMLEAESLRENSMQNLLSNLASRMKEFWNE